MSRVEVIAHRGVHDRWPENSLAAIGAALEAGADGVEIDVHATADAVVVVHHDPILPATELRPAALIRELSFADLSAWRLVDGSPLPRLADVLELCAGRARVYVEIKGRDMERPVLQCIRSSACDSSIHSFDHRIIRRCAELDPGVRRGILLESYLVDNIAALHNAEAGDLWQYHELIDSELVFEVHRNGGRLVAWTVNEPVDAKRLQAAGVDAICTDNVAAVRNALWTA